MDPPESDLELRNFSCLTCRQRKVKCDRRDPCSNCSKAGIDCTFVPPVRGKRKRAKPQKEGLHAKVERYEELLRLHGLRAELSEDGGGNGEESDSDTESRPSVKPRDPPPPPPPPLQPHRGLPRKLEESEPVLITKEGSSRYVDSALWSGLGRDVENSEIGGLEEPMNGLNVRGGSLGLGPVEQDGLLLQDSPRADDAEEFCPPAHALCKLQEMYTDRVDPMMKFLHLSTFWPFATEVVQNFESASHSAKALVWSFYLATVSVLEDEECLSLLGAERSVLHSRYQTATRQALINARFLSTSSVDTLKAFGLFMMGLRGTHQRDELFSLSGVAVRLARKMGLHRDGLSLGLSIFDTEIRRRLWWHLVHVDFRITESLSLKPSMDLFSCDAKMPLNVLDEDLSPGMTSVPEERNSITPITICIIRCELINFLRQFVSPSECDIHWGMVSSSDLPITEKDSLIRQFEDRMERRFLRYCDPSSTLDFLVSIAIRSSICKMKIFAHNPRQHANRGVVVPESERDIIFTSASKTLEYATLLVGNPVLRKYMWHGSVYYICQNLLYVLIEARHRKTGPEIDRLWQLIGTILSNYTEILTATTGAVYAALRKWIVEVWDEHVAARRAARLPDPVAPEYVDEIRHRLRAPQKAVPDLKTEMDQSDVMRTYTEPNYSQLEFINNDLPLGFGSSESYDFSDILSFETNPNEWLQWEQLMGVQGVY